MLVLLHGVGMRAEAWQPQLDVLEQHYRVLALDMPGHGDSEPLPIDAQLPDFVQWLADVLDGENLGPVNIAGHSMGALVSLGLTVEHPHHVKRLALLNGVHRRDKHARKQVVLRAAQISAGDIDPASPLDRWFSNDDDEAQARALTLSILEQVDQQGYATAYSAFAQGDDCYADSLPLISCPTLALTGSGDANSTPTMAQYMAQEVQNGHCAIIEHHRHMVNLTAPIEVNNALKQWLKLPTSTTATTPHGASQICQGAASESL